MKSVSAIFLLILFSVSCGFQKKHQYAEAVIMNTDPNPSDSLALKIDADSLISILKSKKNSNAALIASGIPKSDWDSDLDDIEITRTKTSGSISIKFYHSQEKTAIAFVDSLIAFSENSILENHNRMFSEKIKLIDDELNLKKKLLEKYEDSIQAATPRFGEMEPGAYYLINIQSRLEKEYGLLLEQKMILEIERAGTSSPFYRVSRTHYIN